jgi:hypothetical protein
MMGQQQLAVCLQQHQSPAVVDIWPAHGVVCTAACALKWEAQLATSAAVLCALSMLVGSHLLAGLHSTRQHNSSTGVRMFADSMLWLQAAKSWYQCIHMT